MRQLRRATHRDLLTDLAEFARPDMRRKIRQGGVRSTICGPLLLSPPTGRRPLACYQIAGSAARTRPANPNLAPPLDSPIYSRHQTESVVTVWRHVLAIYLLIALATEAIVVRLNIALMRSSDGRRGRWDAEDVAGTIVLAMLWPISLLLLLT